MCAIKCSSFLLLFFFKGNNMQYNELIHTMVKFHIEKNRLKNLQLFHWLNSFNKMRKLGATLYYIFYTFNIDAHSVAGSFFFSFVMEPNEFGV